MSELQLNRLAERIEAEVQAFVSGALDRAREIGGLLSQAKEHVGHGDWEAWVRENTRVSPREARNWMRLHREWEMIAGQGGNPQTVTEALAFLQELPNRKCISDSQPDGGGGGDDEDTDEWEPVEDDDDDEVVEAAATEPDEDDVAELARPHVDALNALTKIKKDFNRLKDENHEHIVIIHQRIKTAIEGLRSIIRQSTPVERHGDHIVTRQERDSRR